MKNISKSLSLRIIGLGCVLLLIASMFLPFVSYEGFSISIFDGNSSLNYLPYVLMVYGLISILSFLLNKKTELSYLLVGGSLTYIITNTIGAIDQFNYFSFGYYLFLISTILLFIVLVILGMGDVKKNNLDTDAANKQIDDSKDTKNDVIQNMQPSEFAQSIMDQPVMNNISISSVDNSSVNVDSNIDNSSINIDNTSIDSNLTIDGFQVDDVSLAPQNPLNSFLPSDFDPSKVVTEVSQNNVLDDSKNGENVLNDSTNENSGQSILSVMSQPMVDSGLNTGLYNEDSKTVQNNNASVLSSQQLSELQSVVEPSIPIQPVPDESVVEPSVPTQAVPDVQSVVEPSIPAQAVPDVQSVVEPSIPAQPVTEVQSVGEPSIPAQPVTEVQSVVEPSIPAQPVTEVQSVVEPSIPAQPVPDVQSVVEPSVPVQPVPDVQSVVEPSIPEI